MFERMLDQSHEPSRDEFEEYCGQAKERLRELDAFLSRLGAENLLRFPYGKQYGWGVKYHKKSKHICDVFAEKDAFTVMLRLTNRQFEDAYGDLNEQTKAAVDGKYPCGDGGWIHARILSDRDLADAKKLLSLKF